MAAAFNERKHHAYNPVMTTWCLQLTARQREKWEGTEGAKRELQGRGGGMNQSPAHPLMVCRGK